ncbi:Proline-rich receptor-like protein kinase PERK4 [Morella rubra]|uniref:non-specific serine/threonine protein kinase n=2 Tax=Morella rubra TaxID=262757 RepID=A0A6A1WQW7_9ROSI|nr:Proline-rich receptor-like protein kinase PERK4 [Morella rubra]
MSSSSATAPSPDSPPSRTAPPPSNSSSSSSPTPSPSSKSSPPPETSPPPPPKASPSPPPSQESPPPPPEGSSSPPPSSSNGSPPPPPKNSSSPPSSNYVPPPPPPHSSTKSPPPPPHKVSPSTPSSGSNSTTSSSSGSNDNLPLIIGVSVAVGMFLIALIVICALCARKKKRKHHHMQMHYYGDPSQKGSEYYDNSGHPNWPRKNSQLGDHIVRLSTPTGLAGAPAGVWASPPPPPVISSSGEMSSSFSGPYKPALPPPSPNIALGFNKSTFTYEELAAATEGFSQANLLGQGGFGYVHKGVLPNGQEVAVKSLKVGSGQGEREFQAEVEIISRVHHRHLVSLVGYCIAGAQRMLVYEFVPNKTLEYHLYGKGLPIMDWTTRLRIALGSAKGLAYLHEDCHPRIIHRDIKAANILLDDNFEAMVADFGLAKLSSDNYTHVSTRVMGTFGYLAPEYASSGKLTEKSDVFSYGVMLLELITGRRPVDPSSLMEDSLVDWARPLMTQALDEGQYGELVDPRLENNYNPNEMARMVASAAACIRHSARKRPRMMQIVRALEGDMSLLEDLNEGVKPGQNPVYSSNGSSDYDTSAYNVDLKKFRKMALSSQEFASGEYGSSSNESREMAAGGNQKHFL